MEEQQSETAVNVIKEGKYACIFMEGGTQGMIDGIFLGNYVGSNAMASVNIANPFLQISIGSAMVVCTGTLSHLGRAIGEKNLKKAQDVFKSSVIGAAVISVLLLLSGILLHKQIAMLLGATEVLLADTARYIQIIVAFIPAISFMFIFGFVNRLLGKPQLYLYATVACMMMNIIAVYQNNSKRFVRRDYLYISSFNYVFV